MQTILLVGAGRMGGALLRGWINALGTGFHYIAIDPHAEPFLSDISEVPAAGSRFSWVESVGQLAPEVRPAAIIIATKPQMVSAALQSLRKKIDHETVLVSIAAGVSIAVIEAEVQSSAQVVRVMPNIGALVGYSVSAGYSSPKVSDSRKAFVDSLFSAVGQFTWLNREEDLHLVTAVSGSGPAYYFAFCEAMIEAAVAEGLSPDLARRLAIGTVISAGRLLGKTPDPSSLRRNVTSPNGTTAAGLEALNAGGKFQHLARNAIQAAAKRSAELS